MMLTINTVRTEWKKKLYDWNMFEDLGKLVCYQSSKICTPVNCQVIYDLILLGYSCIFLSLMASSRFTELFTQGEISY